MKSSLPLLAALAIVGVLGWLLLAGGEPGVDEVALLPGSRETESGERDDALSAAPATGLQGRGTGTARPKRGRNPMSPFKERLGVLEVLPIDPDGAPISVDLCTVSLARINPPEALGRLGLRIRETGVWRFPKVPIGPIQVIVTGDQLMEARETVRVREGTTTFKKVAVQQGALVKYRAELPDGTVAKLVALELITRQGRAADVYWQVRQPRLLTSARRAPRMRQAGEGVVFGIPPGVYELRAKTDDGDAASHEIVVGPGDALDVTLLLR